jgi:Concanavalin A-like lectin/glucanases superfamily
MSTQINAPNNYFQGYFDQMTVVDYCKTAAQVLDDAAHVVYYKFDTTPGLTIDSGPLYITGISNGVSLSSSPAKANQSLYFPSGTNYYQFQGLTYFGNSGWSYSISLWIYPLSQSGGTIVHASGGYGTDGVGTSGWCLPMLGFSSSGVLYAQSASSTSTLIVLAGPTVSLNSWTYVAITYSSTNGLRLYVNNVLQNSAAAFTFISSGSQNTITLGNGLNGASSTYCPQGSISSAQYHGYIDSFSLYSRELNTTDIATLYTTPQP